jgi:hypothetical protein
MADVYLSYVKLLMPACLVAYFLNSLLSNIISQVLSEMVYSFSNYVQFNDKCEFVTQFWMVLCLVFNFINRLVLLNNLIMNKLKPNTEYIACMQ